MTWSASTWRCRPRRAHCATGAGLLLKEDAGDARRVADVLDIPFYVWDFAGRFKQAVIDDFVSSRPRRDPEPVRAVQRADQVLRVAARALALGFDALATGHYARLSRRSAAPRGGPRQGPVLRAGRADRRAVAPSGVPDRRHPKPQIREEAARRGLAVAEKPDSHDICFIPSGDTQAFLGARIGVRRGAVVDAGGTVLAEHDGVHGFTIGQRKGLGIAGPGLYGRPRYVTAIDADTATVHVGDAADLDVWSLTGERPVFTSGATPSGPVECAVQVRAHGGIADAVAELSDGELVVDLRAPLRGVAPGQTMVLYRPDPDGDEVLGSATITR